MEYRADMGRERGEGGRDEEREGECCFIEDDELAAMTLKQKPSES